MRTTNNKRIWRINAL